MFSDFGILGFRASSEATMADRNRWSWDVKGFEPKKTTSSEVADYQVKTTPLARRYSISSSIVPSSELSKHVMVSKMQKLQDKLKVLYFCF